MAVGVSRDVFTRNDTDLGVAAPAKILRTPSPYFAPPPVSTERMPGTQQRHVFTAKDAVKSNPKFAGKDRTP